jgi:recombinational DNA repair protein RecT
MTKEKNTELAINSITDLQTNYKQIAETHLADRFSDNPEFKKQFLKTFSDLIFSQDDEKLEKLTKTRKNTLLNAVFVATEAGASFAKKEVSFIPYAVDKKITEKGVERKVATGEFDAKIIFDINFQKQQILKLKNCKKFFTAEVHESVKVIADLETGNTVFDGINDITKPTIGYYAMFITTEGERYDKFMTTAQIIERAKFSPQFKADKYKSTNNNIHYEKVVVRNLLKEIPKISENLKSIVAFDEVGDYTDYIEVGGEHQEQIEAPKINKLDEAKKEMAKEKPKPEPEKAEKEETAKGSATEASEFF